MDLPEEMRDIIISFVPQSRFLTVCKDWKNQIKNIHIVINFPVSNKIGWPWSCESCRSALSGAWF